jgi:hypothetical protein
MQLDKYISDIKEGINSIGKWPTKMLTERSIEINYTEENIRLSGRIIVAFSVPNGHVNVRVSFYNYNGVRKESLVMRELSVDAVVKQVESFVSAKRDSLVADSSSADNNRTAIRNYMTGNDYDVDCDSKYLAVFKGKGVKVTFKFTDDSEFNVIVTKIRKKYTERDIMFATSYPENGSVDGAWLDKLGTALENIRKRLA